MFSYKGLSAIAIRHLRPSSVLRRPLLQTVWTQVYVTLYNRCVKSILLCGSEVWSIGFLINKPGVTQMENRYDLFIPEKMQLKVFKNVMVAH